MENGESGFKKERTIGSKRLKVKYLPPEYLVSRELNGRESTQNYDSLLEYYSKSRSFLLTIANVDDANDIMMEGVKDYKEYADKSSEMNFRVDNLIQLKCDEKIYSPVLTNLENTYGLQSHRNIFIVFTPEESLSEPLFSSSDLDFVFTDELFNTGINHFIFRKEDIDQKIDFKNNSISKS